MKIKESIRNPADVDDFRIMLSILFFKVISALEVHVDLWSSSKMGFFNIQINMTIIQKMKKNPVSLFHFLQ